VPQPATASTLTRPRS